MMGKRPFRESQIRCWMLGAVLLHGSLTVSTAKEYILTATLPNTLVLIDAAAREVVKTLPIPGRGPPISIVSSPDAKSAYVLTNGMGSISGIDLDSGVEVFRTDFSTTEKRIKQIFAMEISPDGSELFSMQLPASLGLNEYQVLPPRIAVYRTDSGLNAKPVRYLPVPRRTSQLYMSTDGSRLYAVSWDIHVIDPQTGEELEVFKVTNWDRPNFSTPDVLGFWNQYSQAGIFVQPYTTIRTDLDPDNPDAFVTGMMTLDLKTGEFQYADFETNGVVMFSSVVNPVRRNEAYTVYNTLTKSDLVSNKVLDRVALKHTHYSVNISGDGKEIYVGGTMDDIGIYSTDSLERIGEIKIPGGSDMSLAWIRMIQR